MISEFTLVRTVRKFVGETAAVWGLQDDLSASTAAPELFRPVYKLLGAEERVDEIKQEFMDKSMEKFQKRIEKANK